MPLKIITADERLARDSKVNMAIYGPSGIGKTFQARTLDEETTLFVDLEAGTLALDGDDETPGWKGDVVEIRSQAKEIGVHPWELCRAIACILCGPDPSVPGEAEGATNEDLANPYGPTMHANYLEAFGEEAVAMMLSKKTIFVDSITVAGRMCLDWSKRQPESTSEKTGKPDNRSAYGLHGQEMVRWLTNLQHIPGRSIIVVGILDVETDELGRTTYTPQIDGTKAARELPGIFDVVATLGLFTVDENGKATLDMKSGQHRGFVCQQNNGWGVPAKCRGGSLDIIEAPNLKALMDKISGKKRVDAPTYSAPAQAATHQPEAQPAPVE